MTAESSSVERPPAPGLGALVTAVWIQQVGDEPLAQRHMPHGGAEVRCGLGEPPRLLGPLASATYSHVQASIAGHGTRGVDLARWAVDVGYHDQAHLGHECRRLLGVTPGEFLAQSTEGLTLPSGRNPQRPADNHLDITRLREDTGFQPAFDVDRAVPDYVDWLRRHDR